MEKSSLIFITGGVRSGKSSFAEKRATEIACETGGHLHYIAAGQHSDPEMKARIAKHRQDRSESKFNWKTWEHPTHLTKLSGAFNGKDIVLLDCLTTLLNNEFFHSDGKWLDPVFQEQVMDSILEGIEQIQCRSHVLIVVSNEIFHEPIGDNEMVFIYGRMLAHLHQQLVIKAKQAYLVEAGIPLLMKGG
ncbi:bifunctional adenosylcobinamide kinase/adenosylcobinamide-phosphate guanylyltransferase [Bacillus sp. FJAT-29790]|uniref:bifunctional adenosylcobinamide kinase/adenosylcobinamide-phosphate guanylyltransferase n=1 Tax=Bacillus sp. FJAT-29790 TaxID=1895002 RepID=UPI001C22075B|nr:bifunctional adenosylcobinamide kinase/adenosylcobinamide-phosphate guanylyltransferase [Bacillus sp. FJAT-29790]